MYQKSCAAIHINSYFGTCFPPEEWLYKLFMHQACVFENQDQFDMSNKILTNVISDAFTKGHINQPLKEAIEAFQIK